MMPEPTTPPQRREEDARDRELILEGLRRARRLLPGQPPLERFIHHNPLHALEDMPFEEAVLLAAEKLGAEPYPNEAAFARFIRDGRIVERDLAAVLDASGDLRDEPAGLPEGVTRRTLRMTRLLHPIDRLDPDSIRFSVDERLLFRDFQPAVSEAAREAFMSGAPPSATPARLERTWELLAAVAPARALARRRLRPRDRVLAERGEDVDRLVHPVLIRLSAACLDEGIADAASSARDGGLLSAFRALYGDERRRASGWLEGIAERIARHPDHDAESVAIDALTRLVVPRSEWADVIEGTLLSLRGWAGMIAGLEGRAGAPPGPQLVELVAVALCLEAEAVRHVERTQPRALEGREQGSSELVAYEAFVLAQRLGLGPDRLADAERARAFAEEVGAFSDLERRRLWLLAYERGYREAVLGAIVNAPAQAASAPSAVIAQAIFCIDDREESLRRHLEEVEPGMETLGYAGFFGVAMAYRGARDAQPRPLCPPGVEPRHVVFEEPVSRAETRGPLARLRDLFARIGGAPRPGGMIEALFGLATLFPLALRILAPRRFARGLEALGGRPSKTRVRFERGGDHGTDQGFEIEEMASIVGALLRTTGLEGRLAPLVVVVGHGSSSLNNPHEAAYNCGATGGGHGGPNARVFAEMANHPGVRASLAARGVEIPDGTRFVGAYHDTCDDSVSFYDLDEVDGTRRAELDRVRLAFEEARRRSAHERCRRFESAPLELDLEAALAHVERRAVSIAEPRPECGHVTNALCIIGSRQLTRGLFLDRRAFLVSYEPAIDPDGATLGAMLETVLAVCGGINLEYYFSFVDASSHGCGSKIAHNVASLLGVMDGAGSDLRTGLPVQMTELHEPMRLLTVIDADPELLERLFDRIPRVGRLVRNEWVLVAARRPRDGALFVMRGGRFAPYAPPSLEIPRAASSAAHYRGARGHLPLAFLSEVA